MPESTESKIALDQEIAALAAQRTDLKEMQAKAKDVIGLLTLAGTFLGALGKDIVGGSASRKGVLDELAAGSDLRILIFAAVPLLVLVLCLYVFAPSEKWVFNISGLSVATDMTNRLPGVGYNSVAEVNLAYAEIIAGFRSSNVDGLRWRKRALWLALFGICAETAMVVALVAY